MVNRRQTLRHPKTIRAMPLPILQKTDIKKRIIRCCRGFNFVSDTSHAAFVFDQIASSSWVTTNCSDGRKFGERRKRARLNREQSTAFLISILVIWSSISHMELADSAGWRSSRRVTTPKTIWRLSSVVASKCTSQSL